MTNRANFTWAGRVRRFRRCRLCRSYLQKLKYANDAEFREREKARCIAKAARKRDQKKIDEQARS